jgi:hypothetical protein
MAFQDKPATQIDQPHIPPATILAAENKESDDE